MAKGFTIVELLIVIVVIGILAAIVIVAFNGVQNNAYNTSVRNDLSAASKILDAYRINSDSGLYPIDTTTLNAMQSAGTYKLKVNKSAYYTTSNNFIYCYGTTSGESYAIIGRSKSGTAFYVSNTSGGVQQMSGGWQNGMAGACPPVGQSASGVWGYAGGTQIWSTWVSS